MTVYKGTVTDHKALLSAVKADFITEGWTVKSGADLNEIWLENNTSGPLANPLVGLLIYENDSKNIYGFYIRAATAYIDGASFENQESVSPAVFMPLWKNSIEYWLYLNSRRAILVAKIAATYHSSYFGFFAAYASPKEYNFPIAVMAASDDAILYSRNSSSNRMFCDPGENAGFFRKRTTTDWMGIGNHKDSLNSNYEKIDSIANKIAYTWPYKSNSSSPNLSSYSSDYVWFNNLRPNALDELPIFDIVIIDPLGREMVGALDGAYAAPGFNISSEQLTNIGSKSFRFFQNVFRSTGRDFFAVEEK